MEENPYKALIESDRALATSRSRAWLFWPFGIAVVWIIAVVWMTLFRDVLLADGEPESAVSSFWSKIVLQLTVAALVAIAGVTADRFHRRGKPLA